MNILGVPVTEDDCVKDCSVYGAYKQYRIDFWQPVTYSRLWQIAASVHKRGALLSQVFWAVEDDTFVVIYALVVTCVES